MPVTSYEGLGAVNGLNLSPSNLHVNRATHKTIVTTLTTTVMMKKMIILISEPKPDDRRLFYIDDDEKYGTDTR